MRTESGFREHSHTADWELEAWAPDLPGLLEQAARGMLALSGMQLKAGEVSHRSVTLRGLDAESLLVQFLSELLWLQQEENLGINDFSIEVDDEFVLTAELMGAGITSLDKEIKAVTYHNLQVESTGNGLKAVIVFDV